MRSESIERLLEKFSRSLDAPPVTSSACRSRFPCELPWREQYRHDDVRPLAMPQRSAGTFKTLPRTATCGLATLLVDKDRDATPAGPCRR